MGFRLFFLLLFFLGAHIHADESSDSAESGDYLYHHADEVNDYEPNENDNKKPSFLYDAHGQPNRVVEFYAPWCPHCQHFRDHYVKFARQIKMLSNDQVEVYSISCTANIDICHDFEIHSYPKIFAFPQNSVNYTSIAYYELHPFQVLKLFGLEFDQKFEFETEDKKKSRIRGDVKAIGISSKEDVFNDAYKSFDYALRHGVFLTNDPLPNVTKVALEEWLNLMKISMPPTWKIQSLLSSLLDSFEIITSTRSQLLAVLDRHEPPPKKWSDACAKGNKAGGYTCGLWELFHIMTVGVVEWNLVSATTSTIQGLDHAAQTLRNFIFYFFGCDVCRHNFVAAFDNCARDRCHRLKDDMYDQEEWMDLAVWLWETHNAVNLRLLHERAEREHFEVANADEVKSQWPQKADCPLCWRKDGAWDPDYAYKYLRLQYWVEDDIARIYRREIYSELELHLDSDESVFFTWPRLLACVIAMLLLTLWYGKQYQRRKSGQHKRDR